MKRLMQSNAFQSAEISAQGRACELAVARTASRQAPDPDFADHVVKSFTKP
jgi:hypothetical protein